MNWRQHPFLLPLLGFLFFLVPLEGAEIGGIGFYNSQQALWSFPQIKIIAAKAVENGALRQFIREKGWEAKFSGKDKMTTLQGLEKLKKHPEFRERLKILKEGGGNIPLEGYPEALNIGVEIHHLATQIANEARLLRSEPQDPLFDWNDALLRIYRGEKRGGEVIPPPSLFEQDILFGGRDITRELIEKLNRGGRGGGQ